MNEQNESVPAEGTVIKKKIDGKEMLVVLVNRKKFNFGKYKWGKWSYKISNYKHIERVIKEGDEVSGTLFRFKMLPNPDNAIRFHVKSVIPSLLKKA